VTGRTAEVWKSIAVAATSILVTVIIAWATGYKDFITRADANEMIALRQETLEARVQENTADLDRLTINVAKLVDSMAELRTGIEVLITELRTRGEMK
jgi:C4-dicarboxylate-specific signal transduction histidine kinase